MTQPRLFHTKTVSVTFFADAPFDPDETLEDLLAREHVYGSGSGGPLVGLGDESDPTTIPGDELAARLLEYELLDADTAADSTRLAVFGINADGIDVA